MSRVLFLTPPNITLFQPKVYQELGWGASLVAGALESAGFIVDSYDLNAALAKIRDHRHLSPWEKSVLTDIDALEVEFTNPGQATLLQDWLDKLESLIDFEKTYDCIAISLDKKGYDTFSCRGLYHFNALLVGRLQKKIKCPVILGGKDVFKELGKSYVNQVAEKIPQLKIDTVFLSNAHASFPEELKLFLRGEGRLTQDRFIETRSSFRSSAVIPKYNVINRHHLEVRPPEIFPHEVLKKYPQILDIDPMIIVPYRISMGCPYRCAFCDQGRDPIVRLHEIEEIVQTLSIQKQRGFENYRWYDDNLNLGSKLPDMLADAIIKADIDILFSDSANMKHTSVPLFKKLRKAGCVKLWYGSETMSPRLLKMINKETTIEDFYRTLECGVEADIWNGLNLIVSFPHENEEDFQMMTEFLANRQDLFESWELNIFRLLSGTTYEMEAEKMGIKIRYSSDSKRISAFDEIGGMTWEERIVDADRKRSHIVSMFPQGKILLRQNDYVLYSLIRAGFNKKQILGIMDEIYDFHVRNNSTEFLIYNLERMTEPSRTIDIGAHIMGLLSSQSPEPVTEAANYRPY